MLLILTLMRTMAPLLVLLSALPLSSALVRPSTDHYVLSSRSSALQPRAAVRLADGDGDEPPPPRPVARRGGPFQLGKDPATPPLPFKQVTRAAPMPSSTSAQLLRTSAPRVVSRPLESERGSSSSPLQFASDEQRLAAGEDVLGELEARLCEACAECFSQGIKPSSRASATAIALAIQTLEQALDSSQAQGADGGAARPTRALDARTALRLLSGDWRLVFTDSETTLSGGMSGYGALPLCSTAAILQRLSQDGVRAQCVEVLRLPFGASNALVLKGDARVDEDEDGAILVCTYTTVDVANIKNPPALPPGGQLVATALVHVGSRARVERSASGAVFVYERLPQGKAIEDEMQALVAK
jgi:hypothetical protein